MGAGADPGDRATLTPGRGPGWAKLAEALAQRVSPAEIESYRERGYLLVEDALTPQELADIRAAIDGFVERSRSLTQHDSAIELEQTLADLLELFTTRF